MYAEDRGRGSTSAVHTPRSSAIVTFSGSPPSSVSHSSSVTWRPVNPLQLMAGSPHKLDVLSMWSMHYMILPLAAVCLPSVHHNSGA